MATATTSRRHRSAGSSISNELAKKRNFREARRRDSQDSGYTNTGLDESNDAPVGAEDQPTEESGDEFDGQDQNEQMDNSSQQDGPSERDDRDDGSQGIPDNEEEEKDEKEPDEGQDENKMDETRQEDAGESGENAQGQGTKQQGESVGKPSQPNEAPGGSPGAALREAKVAEGAEAASAGRAKAMAQGAAATGKNIAQAGRAVAGAGRVVIGLFTNPVIGPILVGILAAIALYLLILLLQAGLTYYVCFEKDKDFKGKLGSFAAQVSGVIECPKTDAQLEQEQAIQEYDQSSPVGGMEWW